MDMDGRRYIFEPMCTFEANHDKVSALIRHT
jgi:hypothetical protein